MNIDNQIKTNIDNQIKTNIDNQINININNNRPNTAHGIRKGNVSGDRSGNMLNTGVLGNRYGSKKSNMKMNILTSTNYQKEDILNLLSQLTNCPHISTETYNNILNNLPINQHIYVFESEGKPIAMGTIIIEQKLIHGGACVAHIEDIIVDKNYRGRKIGATLVQQLIAKARNNNCYKIILNCSDDNEEFYKHNGFKKKSNGMASYF